MPSTALYDREEGFRSRVVMARYGFGCGEYRYFSYPLPKTVEQLRTALYPRLAPIANGWQARLGLEAQFPADHADYLVRCHAAGQLRPTPLLLRYGPGDYQLPATIRTSTAPKCSRCRWRCCYRSRAIISPAAKFVLTEQRPRRQCRARHGGAVKR